MRASLAGRSGATTVPVGAALLVLASGFGALLAFWLGGPHPAALPGLFDFTSATWGDGLLLPVMTGLLGYAVRTLPAAPGWYHAAFVATVCTSITALLGLAVTAVAAVVLIRRRAAR